MKSVMSNLKKYIIILYNTVGNNFFRAAFTDVKC